MLIRPQECQKSFVMKLAETDLRSIRNIPDEYQLSAEKDYIYAQVRQYTPRCHTLVPVPYT